MGRLFWILIGIIGIVCILLIINDDDQMVGGMASGKFASIAYLSIWTALIAVSILNSGERLTEMARNGMIWLVVILMLMAGYLYRFELQDFAARMSGGIVPGSPISDIGADGRTRIVLYKNLNGHFMVHGQANGANAGFLIDTGASMVVLTRQSAERAGIDVEALRFTTRVSTANGNAFAAPARLDQLKIGDIVRKPVGVLVAQDRALDGNLLGMNFLDTLNGFEIRGDRLILTD